MRTPFVLLLSLVLALPLWAGERPIAGLMWNRSGLPATLPLVVLTMPGRDYVVVLTHPDDGKSVMAGYIHGGVHFRLLVPPGTWNVRFAHGTDWHDENRFFGRGTEWITMDRPMTFGAGIARKRGHIIRLFEQDGHMRIASSESYDLCQDLALTTDLVPLDEERDDTNRLPTPALRQLEIDLDVRNRICG